MISFSTSAFAFAISFGSAAFEASFAGERVVAKCPLVAHSRMVLFDFVTLTWRLSPSLFNSIRLRFQRYLKER